MHQLFLCFVILLEVSYISASFAFSDINPRFPLSTINAAATIRRTRQLRFRLCVAASNEAARSEDTIPSSKEPRKILVVGGNGRVGGSSARHLQVLDEGGVELLLGGRSQASFEKSKARIIGQLQDASISIPTIQFQQLDLNSSPSALAQVIRSCGARAVVHTAGPFQTRTNPTLMQASIEAKVPYVDVCDEPLLCEAGKNLSNLAKENGVVAVTAAGIWPGASALMAAQAVDELRKLGSSDDSVDITMSFFTAGTGNAGATIVSATFLLLCQKALTIAAGNEVEKEPWTDDMDVDFRGSQGVKTVRLLDNPDVFTLYRSIPHINSLSSRFATAPGVWNQLFGAMKTLIPKDILSNTDLMQGLSIFSLPIIRAVDKIVGATNAMRIDASCVKSGRKCTFIVTHDDLEQCVGLATAAFILEIMNSSSSIEPGVYYPAELPLTSRNRILEQVKKDAIVWELDFSD
mmetsp:Transcript_55416/g.64809  ORF Transcript_55416/g.64809 Transcript_55416/m.64809 type:complete len:463 (-) Transcript_55416:375-1763(-)|eukprot:CAMPEP_0194413184 /NCGR_PEP_ID=MMETSP0176-20130528/11703_1 /TAXON_ID=216777 /ORGANISM="Proboscia alata, Strain PI-D3" /LENGTH=462 /DNA_ID=CAMNT_0039216395 /DNA_START=56 /DNA_END=1444 /DNA_ORIENTATION=+